MSPDDRLAALERRVDELESREAIAALLYRYTEAIRQGEPTLVLELMLDAVVVELHHADPAQPSSTRLLTRYSGRGEVGAYAIEKDGRLAPIPGGDGLALPKLGSTGLTGG